MIEINLLPGAGKKKTARGGGGGIDFSSMLAGLSSRSKDKFLIGGVTVTVIALAALAFLYVSQNKRDSDLQARADKAVRDSTRYARVVRDRMKAEAVRDTLLRQVNLIKSIDEDRYVWPHILDEVSRALPQYTWLTVLTYAGTPQGSNNVAALPTPDKDKKPDPKAKKIPTRLETDIPRDQITVRIMGRTVDIQALTRFMRDLEASPFLSNVQLDRSELALDQGKEVTQFQLTVNYSRPDTTQLRRVPLSVAGR